MWLLRNDEKGLLYRVSSGKQHTVSRKEGDLLLQGDQSISRRHAQLFVGDDNENEGVIVKDLSSKYGTFVIIGEEELTQLSPEQLVTLKCGDNVRFGIQWNLWRVEFVPLLVATSTLTQEEKADVKQMVTALGGQVLSDWQHKCTHLTMNKLTVTVKVVCALASAQTIVTPAYWKGFTEALSSMQATLPNPKDFVPPLAEAVLNPADVSFTPNQARCKLFNGYTFVASSAKQLTRIRPMVAAAGGSTVEFSTQIWTKNKLVENKTILMHHSANERQGSQQSQVPDGYIPVARKLRAQGIRCIPESEIGLSVLYCSMTQFCNPRFNTQSLLGSSSSLEATQLVAVICPNSEDSSSNTPNEDDVNSVATHSTQTLNGSKKRAHEDHSDEEEHASKKSDTRPESEDLFNSQRMSPKDTPLSENCSGSKQTRPTTDSVCISKETMAAANPGISLDMFAPSGEVSKPSKTHNRSEIRPSCEDVFGTAFSNLPSGKKINDEDEFAFTSNKRATRTKAKPQEINDDFSFASCKRFKKEEKKADKIDEFSFVTKTENKTLIKTKISENVEDEFSFISSKRSRLSLEKEPDDDEFSFTTKRSNKRCRQSDPDMFASSAESSNNNNISIAGPSKARKVENGDEFCFKESRRRTSPKENMFAFPKDDNSKRKHRNIGLIDSNKNDSEIKIAILSKQDDSVSDFGGFQIQRGGNEIKAPEEPKNLVTYSKLLPAPDVIKKEVENEEEIDELARELHNATIVVVKPLVVARKIPIAKSSADGGKNFKKFCKVIGLNKRAVPHIIGGSDLIPHNAVGQPVDDFPISPPQVTTEPDDDWTFGKKPKNKKFH